MDSTFILCRITIWAEKNLSANTVCLFNQLQDTYFLFAFKNGTWVIMCVVTWHDCPWRGAGVCSSSSPTPRLGRALWRMLFGLHETDMEIFKLGMWVIMCVITWYDRTWHGSGYVPLLPHLPTGSCTPFGLHGTDVEWVWIQSQISYLISTFYNRNYMGMPQNKKNFNFKVWILSLISNLISKCKKRIENVLTLMFVYTISDVYLKPLAKI